MSSKDPGASNRSAKYSTAKTKKISKTGEEPLVLPAGQHNLTREEIGRSALKVLDKLHKAGHGAFLVGGGVRDVLVGLKPKDFDVATDAEPETVRALFKNSRIIGRRFRLVHVVFGREIIEVATFRAAHNKGAGGEIGAAGRIVRDNVYGTIAEDAVRRDFTVNALYFNIADGSIVDYVGGLQDIEHRVFRFIGAPVTRCKEDPVRVLRAVRLAAKLEFDIATDSLDAMTQTASALKTTPPPRMFEELLKLFQGGYAYRSFHSIVVHDLLQYLFPLLNNRIKGGDHELQELLDSALKNTDRRVAEGKPITPAYLLAFMLWPDVEEHAKQLCRVGDTINESLLAAADSVLAQHLKIISIPRRYSGPMREIWLMQPRLERNRGVRALKLMEDRRFRAAYDFLCLRAVNDKRLEPLAKWWTNIQVEEPSERDSSARDKPINVEIWPDARGRSAETQHADSPVDGVKSVKKKSDLRPRRRYRRPASKKPNSSGKHSTDDQN